MGAGGKLSRRTQVLSAIAVVLVFGGGWLTVWKWPHLRLAYRIRTATPSVRAALASSVQSMPLPEAPPADWIDLDLGVMSLRAPASSVEIEPQGRTGVLIQTPDFEIDVPDLLAGRLLAADAQSDGNLRLLSSDGRWQRVGFMAYCVAAHGASAADFQWSLSAEQVYALEQLLFFKALHSQGTQGDTFLFRSPHVQGVVTHSAHVGSANAAGGLASVWVSADDDRDCVIFYIKSKANAQSPGSVLASIRFPDRVFRGGPKAVEQRIAGLMKDHAARRNASAAPSLTSSQAAESPDQP